MNILIPDNIAFKYEDQIREISPDIKIFRLTIRYTENIARKIIRKIAGNMLSYQMCKRMHKVCVPKRNYSCLVDGSPLVTSIDDIDVFLTTIDIDRELFNVLKQFFPNLRWIHSMRGGLEYIDREFIKSKKIMVTNSRGIHSRRIAEFVLACICDVTKHISHHADLKRRKKWDELQSENIQGKTVGILGTGSIGTAIARLCRSAGMRTIGCNRTIYPNDHFTKIVTLDQISEFLKESDFCVVTLPLTEETRGIIGENEFSVMKETATIINVGRSQVIDEEALILALTKRTIAGAVLDVYHPGMLLPNHPYYKFNNVLLTHYSAHASKSSRQELVQLFLTNLMKFIEGKDLLNVVSM